MDNQAATPRCDELAREHQRIMAGPSAPGVVQDWIALAQQLERECIRITEDLTAARLSLYEVAAQRNELHATLEKCSIHAETQ